ncbi:MAG: restriction endonuclease subunit [Patescibacteria group bacterium]|nr:restriction endonuclease subunit [Patescibacteria group bacterium]
MKQGWEIKKLGDLCEISTGKSNTEDALPNGEYSFFDRSKIIKKSSKYLFDCEAIIIAGEGQTFLPKFFSGKFDLHQRAYAIFNFTKSVDINYVYKYLIHFHKYFEEVAVGATARSLRLRHFQELPIPLPPLSEQKEIVAILDKAFRDIAKGKINAEQNLKNTKELFDSYLQSVFNNRGNGWEEKTLGEVCEYDKTPNKSNGLPYVGLEDIQSNTGQLIGPRTPRSVKSLTFHFNNEHVLYGRLRPYLNKVLLPDFEGHCSTEIFPIKPNKNLLDRGFLFHWLISNTIMEKINATWTGATLPRANMNMVLDFKINIPSLKEQSMIVKNFDELSNETKRLESIYQQKISDLEELKKSILQKAFAGKL